MIFSDLKLNIYQSLAIDFLWVLYVKDKQRIIQFARRKIVFVK